MTESFRELSCYVFRLQKKVPSEFLKGEDIFMYPTPPDLAHSVRIYSTL